MQDELLFRIITDEYLFSVFVKSVGIAECLNPTQWTIYKRVTDFHKTNQRCCSDQEASTLFGKTFNVSKITQEFVFDTVLNEIRREKLKYWILNVAESIEGDKVDYNRVFKELGTLKDRLEVHLPKGILANQMVQSIIDHESTKTQFDTIKSGIQSLDLVIKGGLHKSELAFLITPPGRGKSTFLINLFYSLLIQKRTTLFLSNELRAESILSRLYRRILKSSREEFVPENRVKIEADLNRFFKFAKGKGIVHYVPVNVWGPDDVKSWVTAWEKESNTKVDAIVIDYFDRLKKPWGEDNRLKLRALVDDLRDYAVDKNILIATATQTNRSGLNAPLVSEEHVGEAFSKIESADVILSLSQNSQEREQNKGRLTVLKNREFGGVGTIIDVQINWEKMLVTDMEY